MARSYTSRRVCLTHAKLESFLRRGGTLENTCESHVFRSDPTDTNVKTPFSINKRPELFLLCFSLQGFVKHQKLVQCFESGFGGGWADGGGTCESRHGDYTVIPYLWICGAHMVGSNSTLLKPK